MSGAGSGHVTLTKSRVDFGGGAGEAGVRAAGWYVGIYWIRWETGSRAASVLDTRRRPAERSHFMAAQAQISQGGRVRRLAGAGFYLCLAGAAGGMLYAGLTRDFGLGLKVFFASLWALCAGASLVTFLTGEFRVRGAFVVRRARNPTGFYFISVLATVLTVGPLSFLLWLAVRRGG